MSSKRRRMPSAERSSSSAVATSPLHEQPVVGHLQQVLQLGELPIPCRRRRRLGDLAQPFDQPAFGGLQTFNELVGGVLKPLPPTFLRLGQPVPQGVALGLGLGQAPLHCSVWLQIDKHEVKIAGGRQGEESQQQGGGRQQPPRWRLGCRSWPWRRHLRTPGGKLQVVSG